MMLSYGVVMSLSDAGLVRRGEAVTHDAGWSYPSGHVVNTLIWYPVFLLLVERALRRQLAGRTRRVVLVAPVVIVFATVTYLGYHWVTDSVAGVLLGSALWLVLRRLAGGTATRPQRLYLPSSA